MSVSAHSKPGVRLAARWRTARRLYPIYAAIAAEFQMSPPPYENLDEVDERSEEAMLGAVEQWLAETDERVRAFHFRLVLQTTDVAAAEQKLTTLVERYLHKPSHSDSDRDKLDFLLSHYLAVCAPPSFHERKLELDDVAEVLEGVLGECSTVLPQSLAALEELVHSTQSLTSLRVFLNSRIIERGRAIKIAMGDNYFASSALVAFTRFNYVVRRTYRRLIDLDVTAVSAGLRKLLDYGVDVLDCASAGMGIEPIVSLQKTIESWKRPRMREYGGEEPFLKLMELRTIVENEVEVRGTAVIRESQQRIAGLEEQLNALRLEREQLMAQVAEFKAKPQGGPSTVTPAGRDELPELPDVESVVANHVPTESSKPQEKALPAQPIVAPETAADLEQYVGRITREIMARKALKGIKALGSISIEGHALLLNEVELNAFQNPDSDQAQLRRCVAARAALIVAIESFAGSGAGDALSAALASAQSELARITAVASENPPLASVLNPSKAQLTAIIRHATSMARKARG